MYGFKKNGNAFLYKLDFQFIFAIDNVSMKCSRRILRVVYYFFIVLDKLDYVRLI